MSKNFELLQKIGGDEELYRTQAEPFDLASVRNGEPEPQPDKAVRDAILQNASMPSVWVTPKEPAEAACDAVSEHVGLTEEISQPSLQNNSATVAFRTARNPTSRMGTPVATPRPPRGSDGQRTGGSAARVAGTSSSASTAINSRLAANTAPLAPKEESAASRGVPPKKFAALHWAELVKTELKNWKSKEQTHDRHHGADLEALTREEEIKLVLRVFPEPGEGAPRVALFSGLEHDGGCSAICARTAQLLAARGEAPVCVVDANFRSPSLHHYFDVENGKGLVEAALECGPLQNFLQRICGPDLWLMPAGKSPTDLAFPAIADSLRARIKELRTEFRYVIIHAGPLRLDSTTMLISRWTDGVVLVVEANSTRRETAKRVKENLQAANVSLLGVVLNKRTYPIPESIYRRL